MGWEYLKVGIVLFDRLPGDGLFLAVAELSGLLGEDGIGNIGLRRSKLKSWIIAMLRAT